MKKSTRKKIELGNNLVFFCTNKNYIKYNSYLYGTEINCPKISATTMQKNGQIEFCSQNPIIPSPICDQHKYIITSIINRIFDDLSIDIFIFAF